MYLGKSMTLGDGASFAMCGVLDLDTTMQEAKLSLGYRKVMLDGLYTAQLRGHEFHYSRISHLGELQNIAIVQNARDVSVDSALYRYRNTIASYIHLYWGETRDFPEQLFGL